jgi:predicted short-subunit dehydrogenase-like oxidoreductase (DUF2520 family)
MHPLRIVVVGPGKAGGAVAMAASRAGHEVVAVVSGPSGRVPEGLDAPRLPPGGVVPACDLIVLAVRDDGIAEVASSLRVGEVGAVIHLSGFTSVRVLDRFADDGVVVGSVHPLQSLLDPERGAEALRGSFAAVTTDDDGLALLSSFARSLGMRPFRLADEDKPAHHAAAAAASNFVVAALDIASELAAATGVPFEAYATLTRSVVDNAYEVGPAHALTGPVARGDVGTVAGQIRAAAAVSHDLRARYVAMVEATARMADRWDDFADVADHS